MKTMIIASFLMLTNAILASEIKPDHAIPLSSSESYEVLRMAQNLVIGKTHIDVSCDIPSASHPHKKPSCALLVRNEIKILKLRDSERLVSILQKWPTHKFQDYSLLQTTLDCELKDESTRTATIINTSCTAK